MICYTGIGSRETPKEILEYCTRLGRYFAQCGFTLRSGGANGADHAFEEGCTSVGGNKEIYLPWKLFNGNHSPLYKISKEAYQIAEKHHPAWDKLKPSVRSLHARNSHQVMGENLNSPSTFVVCWTDPRIGGTTQAIRIANEYKIPVFNLWWNPEQIISMRIFLKDILNSMDQKE